MSKQRETPLVDYTGHVSGKAKVLGFYGWHVQPSGQRKTKWLCVCECGNEFVATGSNLRNDHTTSCGCYRKQRLDEGKQFRKENHIPSDLNGSVFGRTTVISFDSWDTFENQRVSKWKCVCSCGKEYVTRRSNLNENSSCGCWRSEKLSEARTVHGMHGTPTHESWRKMRERCHAPYYKEKKYYQDEGVTVCERWNDPETGFLNFYEDMGERPDGMTLNRVNGAKIYSKETCEWADLTLQSYDRRKGTNNTSGRVGVFLQPNGLWRAMIGYYGKQIVLAKNVSFEDACKARTKGEMEYYGFTKENY